MSEVRVPECWSHLGRRLSIDAKGLATPWVAPVPEMVATDGFDESFWINEIPDTVVAVRLTGADVVKAKGGRSGATTARGGKARA